jgi:2-methylcitrate dehydratase PrpD
MNETRSLAEFVVETNFSQLPHVVVEATRSYILDNLACGFAGATTPWAKVVAGLARDHASQGPCSLFARDWTTSPSQSTLVNGVMIGGFETDHAFIEGSCHPSAAVFPACLSVAERDHQSGSSFLLSMVMGYEAACRVGLAATRAVEDVAGFHGPGTNAPFGGAAGVGKAIGLDVDQMVNAFGIAGSHAGGLLEFVTEGAMTKRLHVGRGAQMGLESALLAQKGFTGPSTVLEGDHGFLKVYSPSPEPQALVDKLGQSYLISQITVKAYACHARFQAIVERICQFKCEHKFDAHDIEAVRVVGGDKMMERRFTAKEPTSILGAQYSLPFTVAIALCRNIIDPQVYSEETLCDPQVRELAKRIELEPASQCLVNSTDPTTEISLTIAGTVYTFVPSDWKGAPSNPCSYDDIADKFRQYSATFITQECREEIIQRVASIEMEEDLANIARLIKLGHEDRD